MNKEEFEKLDAEIKLACGIVEYTHTETNMGMFSFYSEVQVPGEKLKMESYKDYATKKDAEAACEEFMMLFPIAYVTRGPEKAATVMEKFQMGRMQAEELKPRHLELVK